MAREPYEVFTIASPSGCSYRIFSGKRDVAHVPKEWSGDGSEAFFLVRAANCHDDLLDACKRLQRLASLLTVRQVIEAGEEAIEAAGHNPWIMNEGLRTADEYIIEYQYI